MCCHCGSYADHRRFETVRDLKGLREDKHKLHVYIPGARRIQVDLNFNDYTKEIIISGHIPEANIKKIEKDKHYKELKSGLFERRVKSGNSAAIYEGKFIAGYKDSILNVDVSKVEVKKDKESIRKIQIASHDDASVKYGIASIQIPYWFGVFIGTKLILIFSLLLRKNLL